MAGHIDTATPSARSGTTRRWLVLLLAIALGGLVLRLVYLLGWHNPADIGGDAFYYHHAANLLAAGDGFPNPYRLLQEGLRTPGAQHPPLYSVYLAAFSWVGLDSYFQHQVASCLLGAATVFVVGLAGVEMVGPRTGSIAALLTAVYPNFWLNDALVLSETLVQFTTALVVLTAYRVWRRPGFVRAAALGCAVALAALSRAEMALLVVLLIPPLLLFARNVALADRFKQLGVALACVVATLAPWVTYNLARFDDPVLISAGLEPTLVIANCDAPYFGRDRGFWSYQCFISLPRPPGDESVQNRYYRDVALDYVRAHRSSVPRVVLQRVGRTWGLYAPDRQVQLDFIFNKPLEASRVGLALFYSLAVASVFGALVLRRLRVPLWPVLSIAATVTFAVVLTFGQTRYRAAAEVSLVLLAAVAFSHLHLRGRKAATPPASTPPATPAS